MRHQGQDERSIPDSPGSRARRAWNRRSEIARDLETLPQTIAILEADLLVAVDKHQRTVAAQKSQAIARCKRRLAQAKADHALLEGRS